MTTVREMIHQREAGSLAPWAVRSAESRGRLVPETPCPIRTDFQRDRDRVVHCRAFRRLAHKTQVFILPSQDHIRTRLTHTLEVAQIAKTLARALCLNEDLTEAIALAHDLGHTPFGHAGEWALDDAVQVKNPAMRFHHWEQSLRVVDVLERDGLGLNLTQEVREGILGHTKGRADLPTTTGGPLSVEAQCVKFADRIAYVNHDLDDAIRAHVLSESDTPGTIMDVLGRTHSGRIGSVVGDIIDQSQGKPELSMSAAMVQALNDLKEFLFERVYSRRDTSETRKIHNVVTRLFHHYCEQETLEEHPPSGDDKLSGRTSSHEVDPPADRVDASGEKQGDGACRRACDYVAGMTDRFAVQRYMELFVPASARFEEN
ncbi:MAG: deoxyguanosinetriphosphate triphosphohydrolase [Chloroflexi bacterium]|nr:deoxyguanosinetriphosphate triphosphohydrolase [Chloroflexota bacterium]